MSIAPYVEQDAPREWIALLPAAAELSKAVAQTDFVPEALRGNPAAITACILYGDEVGLGPMQSLAHISVIDGRPNMSAEAMRGLALAAGHEIWVEESTVTRAIVGGRRRDSDVSSRVSWTMDDAKRANLQGKLNWRKYPSEMLIARATAKLCRAIFADAIGGLMATEELDDADEAGTAAGGAVEQGGTRRRRRTLAPVSSPIGPGDATAERTAAPVPPLPGEEGSESGPTHTSAGAGLSEEAPAPSDPDSPETLATQDNLRRKLMATYRERGFETREARLAFARVVTGRPVESANDLTVAEASRVIEALEHGHDVAAE